MWQSIDMTATAFTKRLTQCSALFFLFAGLIIGCWNLLVPPETSTSVILASSALMTLGGLLGWPASKLWWSPEDCVTALEDPSTGVLITDFHGSILSANATATQLLQHEKAITQGCPINDLIDDTLWQAVRSTLLDETYDPTQSLSFTITPNCGPEHALTCVTRRIINRASNASYCIFQLKEIACQSGAKRTATSANLQLRRIVGKSSDVVVFTDSKLTITWANNNAHNAFNTDLIGKPAYYFIDPDHHQDFMKIMQQFTQKNRNEAALNGIRLVEGEHTMTTGRAVRLKLPEAPGYAMIFSTVMEQQQALAESRINQARFSQVFHGTPDAILLLRAADTMVLDFNEGFSRLLGYSREAAVGELEVDLKFWANATERAAIIQHLAEHREIINRETTLRTALGVVVHVEISLRYVEIDNDLCLLCIGRDITKRISAEAALVESEEKFEKMFSQSPDGIVILRHSDGVITDLNDALLNRSGYQRTELIGRSIYDAGRLIDDRDLAQASQTLTQEHMLTNCAVSFLTKEGEPVPALISASIVELSGEEHIMIIAKDISKQRTTEERLRSSEERFRGIFKNAPFGIMLIDLTGRVFQANRTATELLAYDEQELSGLHISRLIPEEDHKDLNDSLSSMTTNNNVSNRSERRMICNNGLELWTNFHTVLQKNSQGQAQYYIVQIADITSIKRSQQRMERMAFYDTLTNLANRRLFHERLEHAIEQSLRNKRASALLYLDLDNFKRVNDTLGHQMGDQLLREVATRLQQCVRSTDTVGRTGGDEFTILLTEIGAPHDAGAVAQKILNHLREPIQISGYPLIVTTSIGISMLPDDSLDPNELMRNADLAMYKAKEHGRNNYQFYSEDLNINAANRLRIEYQIRQALERDEFELFYQPKISLSDHRIVGVESLIRWHHPDLGLIGPDEFIAVAEETGSIIDIGAWVIKQACHACQVLSAQQQTPIQVAINISPRQFRDPNLVATMRRSLLDAELDPQNIEIEITETMLMQDINAAQNTINQLSKLGVRLAIDDFGTGYSSLNYLKRFPINTVKIDRSFVVDLPSNADDMAITRAVIAMAHQLKMEVVAEGVETKEQLAFLKQHQCEYAQGWLFSQALPLKQMLSLLAHDLKTVHLK
ncbi:MAG: EAL domain-containing protein [Gammaproteobacteria bacterium]|nr:EAL domain-containing protein [Gammaproteobacteria bacterium]